MSYILAKFDVSGIQDYIFATNRLQENAGASYQVTRVLDEFLIDTCDEVLGEEAVVDEGPEETSLRLPGKESSEAEILYIGGGNAMVLFRNRGTYEEVRKKLTYKVMKNCQGIYLAVACIETELKDFLKDREKLDTQLAQVKRRMVRIPNYSPFPVVEQDNDTHQPITAISIRKNASGDSVEYITEIQRQKREGYELISRNKNLFPELENGQRYKYPKEMEVLSKRRGEDSTIAVVHIDGNGMGNRMHQILTKNRNYDKAIPALRKESQEIAKLFRESYQEVLQELVQWQVDNKPRTNINQEDKELLLPLRPILMDGDDFTFLCTAELAVPMAAGFIKKLMDRQKGREEIITACGGIAFVHSHFPFRIAYSIAEESCARAKKSWYQRHQSKEQQVFGYLDFQVIKGSELTWQTEDTRWKNRPYMIPLKETQRDKNSLKSLIHTLDAMQSWPSGRLHKIYAALQRGDSSMQLLEREFESRGYHLEKLTQGRWEESPLFDALELQGLCQTDLLKRFTDIARCK